MLRRAFKFFTRYKNIKAEYTFLTLVKIPEYKEELKVRNRTVDELKTISNKQRTDLDKLENKNTVLEKKLAELTLLIDAKFVEEGPPSSDDKTCKKQKCCSKQEAQDFAFKVKARTKQEFIPYECDICPVSKRTGKKWWHITHKERFLRGIYGSANIQ